MFVQILNKQGIKCICFCWNGSYCCLFPVTTCFSFPVRNMKSSLRDPFFFFFLKESLVTWCNDNKPMLMWNSALLFLSNVQKSWCRREVDLLDRKCHHLITRTLTLKFSSVRLWVWADVCAKSWRNSLEAFPRCNMHKNRTDNLKTEILLHFVSPALEAWTELLENLMRPGTKTEPYVLNPLLFYG